MTGKTVLITGGSSGLGLEAGVKIAALGATVILTARDAAKADGARAQVRSRSRSDRVVAVPCDLSSLAAVRRLVQTVRAEHPRLDVLINNAGTVSPDRQTSADGYEQTFAVNHLAHFVLTNGLLDTLEKSAPSRIVNVASVSHRQGDMDFANLHYERGGYTQLRAYSRSKLANVLFTRELARRLAGTGVTVNALHPGTVATNIWSHTRWPVRQLLRVLTLFMLSAERAADTLTYLATSPDVEGRTGGYYEKNRLVEPSALAKDEAVARLLWEESEGATRM